MHANRKGLTIQVAVAQVSSTYQDAQASLAKALALIEEASAAGAKIVCLGETFLPGYPAWLDYCMGAALWNYLPVKEVFAELRANSVVVPGIETTGEPGPANLSPSIPSSIGPSQSKSVR